MLDKLRAVESRFEELEFKSGLPDFYADPTRAAKLLREKNDLEPIVACYRDYLAARQEQADAEELMADPEMREFCQETFREAKEKQENLASIWTDLLDSDALGNLAENVDKIDELDGLTQKSDGQSQTTVTPPAVNEENDGCSSVLSLSCGGLVLLLGGVILLKKRGQK